MELNQENLTQLLEMAMRAAFAHERDKSLGYPGDITPLRAGLYFECKGADGNLYVLDNTHLARTLKVSVRKFEVITDQDGDGIADVGGTDPGQPDGGIKRPAGGGLGGLGVTTLFTLLGIATGNPALGPATQTSTQAIGSLILGYLQSKLARHS